MEQRRRVRPVRRAPGGAALALLLVLGLLSAACNETPGSNDAAAGPGGTEPQEADPVAVRVASVTRQAVSSLYSTSATLRADKRATVTTRTRGVLRELLVEEGDDVREADPLAVLEDDEQRIEYERATAAYRAKARELERAAALHEQGLLSEEAYEQARRDHDELRQAAALAELNLSRTRVRAPFGGKVLRRYVDVGSNVSDGQPVYDLADLDPLYADVNVPERHVARLFAGQQVRVRADASERDVAATIERLSPAVDPETGTVKVTITVRGSAGLRPGAFVRVDVVTDTHADALVVPRSALVSEGRRWHLFRLSESGDRVEQLEVRPGFEEGPDVEVLEVLAGGPALEPGARVVVVGAAALTDGAVVRVVGDPGAEDSGPPAAGA